MQQLYPPLGSFDAAAVREHPDSSTTAAGQSEVLGSNWGGSLPAPLLSGAGGRSQALAAATLAGLLHLLHEGRTVAALKGVFPAPEPQPGAAAGAGAAAGPPALHPGHRPRRLADGVAPLHLVVVPHRLPMALRLCGTAMLSPVSWRGAASPTSGTHLPGTYLGRRGLRCSHRGTRRWAGRPG